MNKIIISVDAMGGAHAPKSVVDAVNNASKKNPHISFKLFGDSALIKKLMPSELRASQSIEIIHTTHVISDDEQPVKALKTGRESSMYKAIRSVKDGEAHACISGGNTGALMVMAKLVLGSLPNVKRPAIINIFPNSRNKGTVMLDLGANAECDSVNLFQFALMGHCYSKCVMKVKNPSIGILNVGTEDYKGRDLEKRTFQLLSKSGLNFFGHVEGYDITQGTVDVIVTDGFSGNLVIKSAEGTAHICKDLIKEAFNSSWLAKLGGLFAKKALKKVMEKVDPRNYNGAMFAGVNGIVVKSHGSTDIQGFENAINVTTDLIKQDVNSQLSHLLVQLHDLEGKNQEGLMSKIKSKFGLN